MILDEKVIAEEILTSKRIVTKSDIGIIARYLRNEMKCDVPETLIMLSSIMTKINRNFNPIKSAKFLEKLATKSENIPLRKIEYIKITSRELAKIGNVESLKLQRLLFVILVYAKYNNQLSVNNNNWCNVTINELYRYARVSTRNAKEKGLFLNRLASLKLISFSAHNTNLNIKCNIVDNEPDNDGIKITDIRELGYQYLNLNSPNEFTYCGNCGVIMKKKNKNDFSTKICSSCQKTIKNENNLNWFHNLDKAYHS